MIDTVNARDLHAALEVGKDYSTWIKKRIEECNFKENEDFVVFTQTGENPLGGRPAKERFLSLDMAKHLAMLEKNHQGKKVRTYFIEHEKQSRAIMPPSLQAQVSAAVAKAMEPMLTQMGSLSKALEETAPKALGLPASIPSNPGSNPMFKFEGKSVRVVMIEDKPWFVAADIRAALDMVRGGANFDFLREDEVCVLEKKGCNQITPLFTGRANRITLLSESGLYKFVLRSDKLVARRFQDWLTREVLPAIRKDGMYVMGEEKVKSGEMSHHLPRKPAGYEVIFTRQ